MDKAGGWIGTAFCDLRHLQMGLQMGRQLFGSGNFVRGSFASIFY